jgi:hypothetical protein
LKDTVAELASKVISKWVEENNKMKKRADEVAIQSVTPHFTHNTFQSLVFLSWVVVFLSWVFGVSALGFGVSVLGLGVFVLFF